MNLYRLAVQITVALVFTCVVVTAQTGNAQEFVKDGLTFEYPAGWTLQDDSNKDGQSLTLSRADSDVSINVFVHRGRITAEKLPEAKKAFIDPYIAARNKQFADYGAKPVQSPDSSEIAGQKADGVVISANLGGEPGAAKIYWALIGSRVVLLTYFGPDKQIKQFASVWDIVRNSVKVEEQKAPSPTPKP